MNSNILVVENAFTEIAKQLGAIKLEYNNQSKDSDIHAWLISNKQAFEKCNRVIIPCRLGNEDAEFMGLYIALHIRLTRELGNCRLLPLIFLSDSSKDDILSNQIQKKKTKSALLLFTKGCYLTSVFDLDKLLTKSIDAITEDDLVSDVLPNLSIENTRDTGHQMANEWGAFRLAKFAGCELKIVQPASLFFKYKDAFTKNEIAPEPRKTIGLFDQHCKALLIDDNADAGWSEVLQHVLRNRIVSPGKTSTLDVLKSYEEANTCNAYHTYDIVFLDLRLLKEEDKIRINHVNDFSGTRILKKIKTVNKGIQVVIFTASNKVWNIEKLLELGANGYYIKESPEYVLSENFSKENFEEFMNTIKSCLTRRPLKEIYNKTEKIKAIVEDLVKQKKLDKSCGRSIEKYVELGYNVIENTKSEVDHALGYLILFKCLELINDNFIVRNLTTNDWTISIYGPLKQYKFDDINGTYIQTSPPSFNTGNSSPSTFEKLAGIGFQKLLLSESEVKGIYFNILRRNKYIHPDDGTSLTSIQKKEVQEIYSYEGYLKLISSVELIIQKLKERL